jgi:hypothetical protein
VNDMKKWMWWLIPGALLVGALIMAGCFASPTDPNAGAFTSVNSGNGGYGGGGKVTPTPTAGTNGGPTATATVTIGGGSISGTVSGAATGTIYMSATRVNSLQIYRSSIAAPGAYTISGLPDGGYSVVASDAYGNNGTYSSMVTVSGGGNVTGINITMH